MTVGVSFGAERDAAFEHAKNRCIVSMPQVIVISCKRLDLENIYRSPGNPRGSLLIYLNDNFPTFFSQTVLFIHLDAMLTSYGDTEFLNYHLKCSTMKEEYQSLLGVG